MKGASIPRPGRLPRLLGATDPFVRDKPDHRTAEATETSNLAATARTV